MEGGCNGWMRQAGVPRGIRALCASRAVARPFAGRAGGRRPFGGRAGRGPAPPPAPHPRPGRPPRRAPAPPLDHHPATMAAAPDSSPALLFRRSAPGDALVEALDELVTSGRLPAPLALKVLAEVWGGGGRLAAAPRGAAARPMGARAAGRPRDAPPAARSGRDAAARAPDRGRRARKTPDPLPCSPPVRRRVPSRAAGQGDGQSHLPRAPGHVPLLRQCEGGRGEAGRRRARRRPPPDPRPPPSPPPAQVWTFVLTDARFRVAAARGRPATEVACARVKVVAVDARLAKAGGA